MSDAPYIRNVIRVAIEARRCIRYMKPAERIARDDLGTYLKGVIDRLKGLHIPAHLKEETANRDAEIGACEDAIRNWLKERGQAYLIPRGPIVHVDVSLQSLDGCKIERTEGDVSIEAPKSYESVPGERLYGRGRVVLRCIDGGKK